MKTLLRKLMYLSLFLMIVSCVKEEGGQDNDNEPGPGDGVSIDTIQVEELPIPLIWQKPLAPKMELGKSVYPLLLEDDKIVYTTRYTDSFNGMFVSDRLTGEQIWTWDKNHEAIIASAMDHVSCKGDIFLKANNKLYKVDGNTGQTEWQVSSLHGYNNITIIGDYIYHGSERSNNGSPISYLIRTHKESSHTETLFQIETSMNDDMEPGIIPPVLWINENQDSILIFSCRNLDVGPIRTRLDLMAWNLSTRKFEWINKKVGPRGIGTRHEPVIYDRKGYIKDSEHIICFDLNDGSIIWQSEAMTGHAHVPLLFAEGKLFVNPDGRDMYALDPDNGSIIWHKTGMEAPASASHTLFYDGKLYSNGITDVVSKLHCIDPSNGETIWMMRSPNLDKFPTVGYSNTDGGLSIDPERGYLYISDGHFNQCFDLNTQ